MCSSTLARVPGLTGPLPAHLHPRLAYKPSSSAPASALPLARSDPLHVDVQPTNTTAANATCSQPTGQTNYTYSMEVVRKSDGAVLDSCNSTTVPFECAFSGLDAGSEGLEVVCKAFPPADKPETPVPPPAKEPLDLM